MCSVSATKLRLRVVVGNRYQTANRELQPPRSIVEFVQQFVERLFEQQGDQKRLCVLRRWKQIGMVNQGLSIPNKKCIGYGIFPEPRPRQLRRAGCRWEGCVGRIAEAPQHPSYIFEWRIFAL